MMTRGRKAWYLNAAAGIVLALGSHSAFAAPPEKRFDIPAQDLAPALRAFGVQADQQIIFSDERVRGRRSPRVEGSFTVDEALQRLIEGSGLTPSHTRSGTIILSQASPSAPLPGAGGGQTAGASPVRLEEIIVTARRRSESVQSVPIAVTAIGGASLERHRATDLTGISSLAPNLHIYPLNVGASTAGIFMRGFGVSQIDPAGDPAVAVYVDGVYQALVNSSLLDLFDVERIEVLRGPQGTLLGKNSPSGALMVTTKRPTGEWGGRVQLDYGRFDRREVRVQLEAPLVKGILAGKVSFLSTNMDNYVFDTFTNRKEQGGEDKKLVRASLLYTPTPNFEWFVNGSYLIDRSPQPHIRNVGGFALDQGPGKTGANGPVLSCTLFGWCNAWPKRYTTGANLTNDNYLARYDFASNIKWDLNAVSLNVDTGYQRINAKVYSDVDGTPDPILDVSGGPIENRQVSNEVRLSSVRDGGLDLNGHLNWVIGAYYFTNKYSNTNINNIFGTVFTSNQKGKTESYAVFGHFIYTVLDPLDITFGVRQTWDRKEHSFVSPGFSEADRVAQNPQTWSENTLEAGLQYRVAANKLAYFRYAQGYRGGGFAGIPNLPTLGTTYQPETVDALELGLKSEWFNQRLRVNIDVFHNKYKNLQRAITITGLDLNGNPTFFQSTQNAATAVIQGVELDVALAVNDHLTLQGTFGYLDPKYKSFMADLVGNGIITDNSGLTWENTPDFTMFLDATYTFRVAGFLNGAFNVNYDYRSKQNMIDNGATYGDQKAYGLLNTSLRFADMSDKYSLTVYARNILSEHYYIFATSAPPLAEPVSDGLGATWGISLGIKF